MSWQHTRPPTLTASSCGEILTGYPKDPYPGLSLVPVNVILFRVIGVISYILTTIHTYDVCAEALLFDFLDHCLSRERLPFIPVVLVAAIWPIILPYYFGHSSSTSQLSH